MNFPNTTPGGGLQPALRPAAGLPALPPDLSPFMDLAAADEINVGRIMMVLRKRKWIVVGTLVATVLITAVVSLKTIPLYVATGRVLIGHETPMSFNNKDSVPDYSMDDYDYTITLETQMRVIQSSAIGMQVIREQHLDPVISASSNANQLPSAVADTDPARLAAALGAFHGSLKVA